MGLQNIRIIIFNFLLLIVNILFLVILSISLYKVLCRFDLNIFDNLVKQKSSKQ